MGSNVVPEIGRPRIIENYDQIVTWFDIITIYQRREKYKNRHIDPDDPKFMFLMF
jgi:hypothetical protein